MATRVDDIQFALRVEFDRMQALQRPLSVLVLHRRDLGSFLLPGAMAEHATVAIANNTRVYDSVGLLTDRLIVLVLPETDPVGAEVTSERIRAELAARNDGHDRWFVLEFTHVEQYGRADVLIDAILRTTRPDFVAA